jgi:hypothetical protein
MRVYARNPNHDGEPVEPNVELLLDDADDELVPLTPIVAPTTDIADVELVAPTRLVASPRWTPAEQLAYRDLARFVSARAPTIGWRFVLFVVSGICLRPARAERALRESVKHLLDGVDPLILDPEKEASS